MRKTCLLLLALLGIAQGCSTSTIVTSKDKEAPVASYKTFQWLTQDDAHRFRLSNPNIDYLTAGVYIVRRPDVEDRVRAVIEKSLQQRGYRPSGGNPPDFYVTFYAKAKNDDWVSTWEGYAPGVNQVPVVIFPDFDKRLVRSYREGLLFLTMYDAKTQKPSWMGSISSSHFGSKFTEPEVASALDRMVGRFHEDTAPS